MKTRTWLVLAALALCRVGFHWWGPWSYRRCMRYFRTCGARVASRYCVFCNEGQEKVVGLLDTPGHGRKLKPLNGKAGPA